MPIEKSLRNRLIKGMSSQAFFQGVQILIRLIEVPIFLNYWGAEKYGEWLMLVAIPTYLSMGDGGFTQTACRDITMKVSKGDKQGALITYQSVWGLLVINSALLSLLIAIIIYLTDIKSIFKFTITSTAEANIVVIILVLFIIIGFQGGLFNSGFWAVGKYPLSMFFNGLTFLLSFCGMVLGLVFFGGIIHVAFGYLLGKIIGTLLQFIIQKRICSWLHLGFDYCKIPEIRRLFVPSLSSLAFPVGNAFNVQGVRLVIGLLLGPSALAWFVPLRTLSNFVDAPSQIIRSITEPEMAMAYGNRNNEKYRNLFVESLRISFWTCLFLGILLLLTGKWIFQIWTGGTIPFDQPTYVILVIAAILNSIWGEALMVSYSTNRHGKTSVYFMTVYGFVYVLISYGLASLFGIIGPAIALCIVEIIMNIAVIPQSLRLTDTPLLYLTKKFALPPINEVINEINYLYKYISSHSISKVNNN